MQRESITATQISPPSSIDQTQRTPVPPHAHNLPPRPAPSSLGSLPHAAHEPPSVPASPEPLQKEATHPPGKPFRVSFLTTWPPYHCIKNTPRQYHCNMHPRTVRIPRLQSNRDRIPGIRTHEVKKRRQEEAPDAMLCV